MGEANQVSEQTLLAQVERRLIDDFPHVPPAVVAALVHHEHARFETSRIREFVPLFVEKHARRQLRYRANEAL
jgi:hypothetical protein